MMEITEGSHAVAEAVRLCRPQVVSAYPITPQTHIVEALADFVANGTARCRIYHRGKRTLGPLGLRRCKRCRLRGPTRPRHRRALP